MRLAWMIVFLPLLAIAVCLPVSAGQPDDKTPAWIDELGYRTEELVPIRLDRFGCPTIEVMVNGEAIWMEFDTGNMTGLSIAPGLARRLKLPVVGHYKSYDSAGRQRGEHPIVETRRFVTLGENFQDQRMHVSIDDHLAGLVGPRYVIGKRFTIDYGNRLLAVSDSALPDAPADVVTLPLISASGYEGMIVIEGALNGQEVLIQVDTGKSRTCVDPETAAKLSLPKTARGYQLEDVRLGHLRFTVAGAKPVGFRGISETLPRPIALGIGSDILRRVVMTVDYRRGVMLLAKQSGAR